jgi:hypothetical protein
MQQREMEKDMRADNIRECDILLNVENADCTDLDREKRELMKANPKAYFKAEETKQKAEQLMKQQEAKKAKEIDRVQRENAKKALTAAKTRSDANSNLGGGGWASVATNFSGSSAANSSKISADLDTALLTVDAVYKILKNDFIRKKQPELVTETLLKLISSISGGIKVEKATVLSLVTDPDCMTNLDEITEFLNTMINTSIIAHSNSMVRPVVNAASIISSLTTPQEAIRSALTSAATPASSVSVVSSVRKSLLQRDTEIADDDSATCDAHVSDPARGFWSSGETPASLKRSHSLVEGQVLVQSASAKRLLLLQLKVTLKRNVT